MCCIISGGNIDINNIEKIVNKAQIIQGRRMHLTIKLSDSIGQVNKVTEILKNNKVNILYLNQTRYDSDLNVNEQLLSIVLECKNKEHGNDVLNILKKEGFIVNKN